MRRRSRAARPAWWLLAASAACSDAAVPPEAPTLVVRPERVVASQGGQRVRLTAELTGAPAGTPVRWLTEDSLYFVLDTTTTGPHVVYGRTGIYGGVRHVNVLTSFALVKVEVLSIPGAAP